MTSDTPTEMQGEDLALKSAGELGQLFRTRSASPSEVLASVIARAERLEPHINAFAETMYEDAVRQAQVSDELFLRRPDDARPLEGIPLAVKEKHAIQGRRQYDGTVSKEPDVAVADSVLVGRLREAGAVLHARTTTPEFSCAGFTHSRLWGVTRNPWNLQFSPGGSSGGSGASVAAGTSVIATASDIAGSTRIPASFCGLVGYKPPYGRVPGAAPSYLDTYRSDGPLTRTVADAALMYQVMAGQHPSDPVTLPDRPAVPSGRASFAGMQVAVARGLGDFVVEPAIAEAVIRTGEALADAGIEVTEIDIPWSVEETIDALFTHWGGIFAATPAAAIERAPDSVTAYAKHMCERSQSTLKRETWMGGLTKEASMQARLADALRGFDALLLPTVGTFGFTAGDDYLDGASVNGTHLEHYLMAVLTAPFNICNRSPVLSVPIGVSDVGVPIGAQIVGKPYDEASVFQVAYALEHVQPWQQTAPMDQPFA